MSVLRKIFVLSVVLFSVCAGLVAETVDQLPKPTSYVSDFASVMDASSKQQMEDMCIQVDRKAHAQIAVVTVNDLGGEDVFQFAYALQQKWGVGTKPDDRGILLLFAIKDHKRSIVVGKGLEGILNDAKVGDIGRSMVPQLQKSEYGAAALDGTQQIAKIIATDAGVEITPAVQHTYHRQAQQSGGRGLGIGGIIFFLVVLFLIFGRGRGGRGGGGGGLMWFLLGSMMGGGGRGYGGGGGGFGGGGGGDSNGGDGGGFGGFGGGDSGGGGASGDW